MDYLFFWELTIAFFPSLIFFGLIINAELTASHLEDSQVNLYAINFISL